MTETLGQVTSYWKCGCSWTVEMGQPVARGSWEVPTFDGGTEHLEGEACLKCGARLKRHEQTVYPVVGRPGELVIGGTYYVDNRYEDMPPFGGQRFRLASAPFQPDPSFHACVMVEVVGGEGKLQEVTLYKLGIPDLVSGHHDIYNTTYRVA